MWTRSQRNLNRIYSDAIEFLSAWQLVAAADGNVSIKALRRTFGYADLEALLSRLDGDATLDGATFTFDFSEVEQITAPWTMAIAHLVAFVRRHRGRCRLIVDSGQPAAAATMALRAVTPTLQTLERPSRRVA